MFALVEFIDDNGVNERVSHEPFSKCKKMKINDYRGLNCDATMNKERKKNPQETGSKQKKETMNAHQEGSQQGVQVAVASNVRHL